MNESTVTKLPRVVPRTAQTLPEPEDLRVLRLAREALRAEPPEIVFVPRDLRLPQL
jgi:hypothetical protein